MVEPKVKKVVIRALGRVRDEDGVFITIADSFSLPNDAKFRLVFGNGNFRYPGPGEFLGSGNLVDKSQSIYRFDFNGDFDPQNRTDISDIKYKVSSSLPISLGPSEDFTFLSYS